MAAYERQITQDSQDANWNAMMNALGTQESGNNASAENTRTKAYGTFQIMPGNWPSWSKAAETAYGLPEGSLSDSSSSSNQYLVARHQLQKYYDAFSGFGEDSPTGSVWGDMAAAWYTGARRVRLAKERKASDRSGEEYEAGTWEQNYCPSGNCLDWITRSGTFTPSSGNCPEEGCADEPAVGAYTDSVLSHMGTELASGAAISVTDTAVDSGTRRELDPWEEDPWGTDSTGAPELPSPPVATAPEIEPEIVPPPVDEPEPEMDAETQDALAFDDDSPGFLDGARGACQPGFIEIMGQCVSIQALLGNLSERLNRQLLFEDDYDVPDCDENPADVGCPEWEGWADAGTQIETPISDEDEHEDEYASSGGWGPDITDPDEIAELEAGLAQRQAAAAPVIADAGAHMSMEREAGQSLDPYSLPNRIRPPGPNQSIDRMAGLSDEDILTLYVMRDPDRWRVNNPGRQMPAIDLSEEDPNNPGSAHWPYIDSGRPYHPYALSSDDSDRMMRDLGWTMPDATGIVLSPAGTTWGRRRGGRRRPPPPPGAFGWLGQSSGACGPGQMEIMGRCVNVQTMMQNLSEDKQITKELVEEAIKELFIKAK